MRAGTHHILEWNPETRVGTCRSCGPIRVYPQVNGKYASCSTPAKERQRRYRATHQREWKPRVSKYGMTVDDYEALVLAQGGVCAICNGRPGRKRLAVDHDHATGAVRGLLCEACNLALGGFRDDPTLLLRAAEYLAQTRNQEAEE